VLLAGIVPKYTWSRLFAIGGSKLNTQGFLCGKCSSIETVIMLRQEI